MRRLKYRFKKYFCDHHWSDGFVRTICTYAPGIVGERSGRWCSKCGAVRGAGLDWNGHSQLSYQDFISREVG